MDATPFVAACTTPIRRTAGSATSVSAQSDQPLANTGAALSSPKPIRRRAAGAESRPPSQSSSTALVNVPIVTSVSTGCSGCPSQLPLSTSFSGCGLKTPRANLPILLAGASRASSWAILRTGARLPGGTRRWSMARNYRTATLAKP